MTLSATIQTATDGQTDTIIIPTADHTVCSSSTTCTRIKMKLFFDHSVYPSEIIHKRFPTGVPQNLRVLPLASRGFAESKRELSDICGHYMRYLGSCCIQNELGVPTPHYHGSSLMPMGPVSNQNCWKGLCFKEKVEKIVMHHSWMLFLIASNTRPVAESVSSVFKHGLLIQMNTRYTWHRNADWHITKNYTT